MQPQQREARKAVAAAPSLRTKRDRPTASNPTDNRKQRRTSTYSYEEVGRYLYRYGPNGATVYDLSKLTGWNPWRGSAMSTDCPENTSKVASEGNASWERKTPPATPQKSTVPERQKRAPTPRFYQFDRTNAVTIKMTDGEKFISEGSLGRDNYKTTRAIGWLMEIDGGGWVACVGDRRNKPLPLNKAKDAARDMHRSGSGEAPTILFGR